MEAASAVNRMTVLGFGRNGGRERADNRDGYRCPVAGRCTAIFEWHEVAVLRSPTRRR